MSCEKHQAALTAAAASESEPSGDLRAHLTACAACRERAEQQRSLFAAIDNSVRRTVNAPVPPALLQRFEARLAQQAAIAPTRSFRLRWLYTAAALATAAALVLFALPHRRALETKLPVAAAAATATAQTNEASPKRPQQIATMLLQPATPQEIRRDRRLRSVAAQAQPEVLVPPDERIALEHFMADPHGTDLAVALARRVPEQREQKVAPVDTPDIQIASLTVPPIRDTDVNTNSSTNK